MEHAVHLGSQKFINSVSPTARSVILRKVWCAFRDAKQGDTYNIDQLDAGLEDCENVADEDGGEDSDIGNDDDLDFDTGDACGKALTLVKQVSYIFLYIDNVFQLVLWGSGSTPSATSPMG